MSSSRAPLPMLVSSPMAQCMPMKQSLPIVVGAMMR
jgi:hypothetical protein